MNDAGQFVTDQEVMAFVPQMNGQIELAERLIIQGVEQAIRTEYQLYSPGEILGLQLFSDEEISIEYGEIRYDGFVTVARKSFSLKHRPVTEFIQLAQVLTRRVYDGMPQDIRVVERDCFYVEKESGLVYLTETLDLTMPAGLFAPDVILTSWPQGHGVLLATYRAGRDINALTEFQWQGLKMLVLMVVARHYTMFKQNLHHEKSIGGEFGSTVFMREILTPEEQFYLKSLAVSLKG